MPADAAPADNVVPRSNSSFAFCTASSCASRSFCLSLASRVSFSSRGSAFSIVCRSARISSVLMVSMSSLGATSPSTCTTFGSRNARITWQIASDSRMLARNLLPSPSPSDAPRTMPAMSTNDTAAGRTRCESKILASTASRGSGTPTTPTLGSIVANG